MFLRKRNGGIAQGDDFKIGTDPIGLYEIRNAGDLVCQCGAQVEVRGDPGICCPPGAVNCHELQAR